MNNSNSHITDEGWGKIASYLNKEPHDTSSLSEDERFEAHLLADKWQQLSSENKPGFDTDAAWNNLDRNISTKRTFAFAPLLKVAAVIVILLTGYLCYLYIDQPKQIWLAEEKTEIQNVTLSDGSEVVLNSFSSLTTSNAFGKNKREVTLEGEAFFNITPDKKKPFIINTETGIITVLGTSFSVNSFNDTTQVYVSSGIVKVSTPDGTKSTQLVVGDRACITKQNIKFHAQTDTNYLAWKTKKLIFRDNRLDYVAKVLSKVYKKEINIKDEKLNGLRFTGTFDNQSLDIILENLKAVYNIKYIREKDYIEIVTDQP